MKTLDFKADIDSLFQLARDFRGFVRIGQALDIPEGVRYIIVSDTLTEQIAVRLEEIGKRLEFGKIEEKE